MLIVTVPIVVAKNIMVSIFTLPICKSARNGVSILNASYSDSKHPFEHIFGHYMILNTYFLIIF